MFEDIGRTWKKIANMDNEFTGDGRRYLIGGYKEGNVDFCVVSNKHRKQDSKDAGFHLYIRKSKRLK